MEHQELSGRFEFIYPPHTTQHMDKHKQHFHEMRNPSQKSSLWKNTLKQRCMDRMKDSRGEALKRAREDGSLASRVRNVMEDELRRLKGARGSLGLIDVDAPDTHGDQYIDIMSMLEMELMDELKQQEAEILAQYEDVRKFEEAELQETLARYSENDTSAGSAYVPCMLDPPILLSSSPLLSSYPPILLSSPPLLLLSTSPPILLSSSPPLLLSSPLLSSPLLSSPLHLSSSPLVHFFPLTRLFSLLQPMQEQCHHSMTIYRYIGMFDPPLPPLSSFFSLFSLLSSHLTPDS